jgi:hypothetical protein
LKTTSKRRRKKWKTTSKMKKWKTTSKIMKMENDLKKNVRQPNKNGKKRMMTSKNE